METNHFNEVLFVEKYRPQTIEECILPDSVKDVFLSIVNSGKMQNLLLAGGAGCGKTTVARALCNQMGQEFLFVNASEESGIDTLRTKIKNFASTVSLGGESKVVILDEADYLNPQSTQPALRGFIEEFSRNCRFIFTCNFKNRIISPLHSRCSVIDFKMTAKDKKRVSADFFVRLKDILAKESIKADDRVLVKLVQRYSPDWRRVLNEVQRYGQSGTIDEGILTNFSDVAVQDLMASMCKKDFKTVRKWVVDNIDNDPSRIFRKIYDQLSDHIEPGSIPSAILVLAEYQYKSAFVVDQEINLVAALTEIMMGSEFK